MYNPGMVLPLQDYDFTILNHDPLRRPRIPMQACCGAGSDFFFTSSKLTVTIQLARQGIEQILPPQTDATTFALSANSILFLCSAGSGIIEVISVSVQSRAPAPSLQGIIFFSKFEAVILLLNSVLLHNA